MMRNNLTTAALLVASAVGLAATATPSATHAADAPAAVVEQITSRVITILADPATSDWKAGGGTQAARGRCEGRELSSRP